MPRFEMFEMSHLRIDEKSSGDGKGRTLGDVRKAGNAERSPDRWLAALLLAELGVQLAEARRRAAFGQTDSASQLSPGHLPGGQVDTGVLPYPPESPEAPSDLFEAERSECCDELLAG